jgi:hypothetical protein
MSASSDDGDEDWLSDGKGGPAVGKAKQPLPLAFRNMFGKAIIADGSRFAKKPGPKAPAKGKKVRGGILAWKGLESGAVLLSKQRAGSRLGFVLCHG